MRPVEEEFGQYKTLFEQILTSDDPLLGHALKYVLQRRGKQLRPLLVLLSAKICRGVSEKTIQSAAAMELLHTASLVHDDVVDMSPVRRGQPALHTRLGNKAAVLVGDFMMSRVVGVVAALKNTHILNIVANLGTTLASGELLQLHKDESMWITEERYYDIISRKTACLFSSCMEAGAESAGASMRQSTALSKFGWHLGMCFQMKDDILDYSDSEELGKPTMNDIRDGKVTLPLLIAVGRAPESEAEEIRRLAEELAAMPAKADADKSEQILKSFVMRYDGVRYAYQQMRRHKEMACQCLSVFRESAAKDSLSGLVEYAVSRLY